MPKPKTETTIPLICTLCPKIPQFSDVSHLLTHISSKSHLSHRFKLQIRAQTDISAVRQLDDFDNWYKSNSLDAMLADRMAAKEQKKTAKERKAKMSAAPVSTSPAHQSAPILITSCRPKRRRPNSTSNKPSLQLQYTVLPFLACKLGHPEISLPNRPHLNGRQVFTIHQQQDVQSQTSDSKQHRIPIELIRSEKYSSVLLVHLLTSFL